MVSWTPATRSTSRRRRASALKRFGDAWLGRDPDSDEPVPQPVVEGITPHRLHEITASPRHYGFHATLKAPFYPVPGLESDALLGDVEAFAAAPPAVAGASAGG